MTTIVFDLDETLINSKHRTPNNPDGTLNLAAYKERHTPENVFKDTLLPLVKLFSSLIKAGVRVAICTARDMKECDYEFLKQHGLESEIIMSRDRCTEDHYNLSDGAYKERWLASLGLLNSHTVMIDDSSAVKAVLRKAGVKTLCAHKLNKRFERTI